MTKIPANHKKIWTKEDESYLIDCYIKFHLTSVIASYLERSVRAVEHKINEMGLNTTEYWIYKWKNKFLKKDNDRLEHENEKHVAQNNEQNERMLNIFRNAAKIKSMNITLNEKIEKIKTKNEKLTKEVELMDKVAEIRSNDSLKLRKEIEELNKSNLNLRQKLKEENDKCWEMDEKITQLQNNIRERDIETHRLETIIDGIKYAAKSIMIQAEI